jgi:hypothetical protein
VAATRVRRRRTRTAAVTAPTAIDDPAIRIVASDPSRSPGRARHMGPSAPGRRASSPRQTQVPDGSNAADVVKARGGDPGINRAASIAKKPRRSSKAWTFLSLARRMTVASSCVRPAVRASAKAASTVPENIAGVSRIHVPRAIAGAAAPAATISSRRSAGNAAAGSHRPQTRRRRVRSHRSGGGKASIQPSLGRPRKL